MPNIAQGVLGEILRSNGSRAELPADDAGSSGVYRRLTAEAAEPGHLLSKHHFFKQLQLEKRRTDRSKAPLSMAVFRVDIVNRYGVQNIKDFSDLLQKSKRETDILGYLGEDQLALLLPDTNEEGVRAVTRNVVGRAADLSLSTTVGTYPDQLFDSLMSAHQLPTEIFPLFLDEAANQSGSAVLLKRIVDIIGSIALILLLSPVMLVTALAIALGSPGPIIFKQIRLGRRGAPFVFYKFRSMLVNADDQIHREYVTNLINGKLDDINQGDATNPHYKIKADPRVTRIGSLIRGTSIDELPQLFNVLKGDMSLVGPRPPLPYEAEKYQSWHLRRVLEIRPGITGLWQVEGRSKTSFDDMVRLDLRYIRSCSPLLDLKILLKTVLVVLKRDGAT
jgi:lipopolysaccharide/colanic/teichoic acid biosynthesis glycosyltransferase